MGDRTLKAVAQVIQRAAKRPADLAARYGGRKVCDYFARHRPEGIHKSCRGVTESGAPLEDSSW